MSDIFIDYKIQSRLRSAATDKLGEAQVTIRNNGARSDYKEYF